MILPVNNKNIRKKGEIKMENIITLKNIRKTYFLKNIHINALKNINLTIPKKAFTAIIGQSGSGKSTLMNILGCLDTADSGEYFLGNTNISLLKEQQLSYIRNHIIGFIFQSFNLIPSLNALENTELPLIYRGVSRHERKSLAKEALELVGLSDRMFHRPNELSGGQQQRVAIARTIAAKPELLLADEPTGSLDSQSGEEVMTILKKLNQNTASVVLITHDHKIAQKADNRIKISDGNVIL